MRRDLHTGGMAMGRHATRPLVRSAVVVLLATALLLGGARVSEAQQAAAPQSSAELTRVVGRVEVLRKGQAQWVSAVIGARLTEGDDIRAFSGATAELTLPDTSTIVLAENSRLLVSRLSVDPQNQSRTVLVHLAVGKARAIIAQAAIALVRARQSNFAITTPTAVAAARGTIVWVFTDGQNSIVAVEPQKGIPSRVECLPVRAIQNRQQVKPTTIYAGSQSTECGPPVPLQPQFLSLSNKATENSPFLTGLIVAPSPDLVLQALNFALAGIEGFGVTSFFTIGDLSSFAAPSTFGQDINAAQGPPFTPGPPFPPPGPPPDIPPISPQ